MYISKNRKRIVANDEVEEAVVNVEPEASDLLFEAEDVANLIAEVTESDVEVEVSDDGDTVSFTVDDNVYTVEAEGNEELVESSTRVTKKAGSKKVTASRKAAPQKAAPRKAAPRKPVTASTRTVRRVRK